MTNNEIVEANEIEHLKTHPDRVFAYVRMPSPDTRQVGSHLTDGSVAWADGAKDRGLAITTWPGTSIATHVFIGPSRRMGFGSKRRAVDCRIFGVRYTGWYFESSGDYCRLKKATRQ